MQINEDHNRDPFLVKMQRISYYEALNSTENATMQSYIKGSEKIVRVSRQEGLLRDGVF